jgi:hypothetical protein
MGIDDRDYMKRPCDDDGRGSSPESKLEVFFSDFLRKHPRLLLGIVAILAGVIVIAVVLIKISGSY